jgi:hypothetical protein
MKPDAQVPASACRLGAMTEEKKNVRVFPVFPNGFVRARKSLPWTSMLGSRETQVTSSDLI